LIDAELRQRADDEAVAQALAGIEGLSDAEVQRMLAEPAKGEG
jgi:hypothetical protein